MVVRLLQGLVQDAGDPDASVMGVFAVGVPTGVGGELPRAPAGFARKRRWALGATLVWVGYELLLSERALGFSQKLAYGLRQWPDTLMHDKATHLGRCMESCCRAALGVRRVGGRQTVLGLFEHVRRVTPQRRQCGPLHRSWCNRSHDICGIGWRCDATRQGRRTVHGGWTPKQAGRLSALEGGPQPSGQTV